MIAFRRLLLCLLLWLLAASFAGAQTASHRNDLLKLLPDDFAVCVILHDLRGHAERWEKSAWLKRFRATAVGKALLESREMKEFERFQAELKKHLDLDWATLRDDILGDTVVLAYSPGPKSKPDDERGLVLLHLRTPAKVEAIVSRLNEAQKKSGELKSLTEHEYKGTKYYCRQEADKSKYYLIDGSLAIFTPKEELLRAALDRRAAAKGSQWIQRIEKAGADRAVLTMCVNPRALDAELASSARKDDPLPSYWRALDALFVTVSIHDDAELRIAIQARADQLPKWARPAFTGTIPSSSLWQRFPEQNIVTFAASTDFAGGVEALKALMPEDERKKLSNNWKSGPGAIFPIDLFKDLLPNIGPDWGICVLPSKNANEIPGMMFALQVKPGSKDLAVDRTLFNAVEIFAGFAILDHNKKNPQSLIRLETIKQGDVEVKYLAGLPDGLQPACALKDGFLIFATSPAAIAEFRLRDKRPGEPKEALLLRVSAPELAKLLDHRRQHILNSLTAEKKMTPKEARQNLENVISLLHLFDRATLSQQGDAGQSNWIIRLSPAK
jgi:hypothetical protein